MMVILVLVRDFKDLKERLNNILIGIDINGKDLFVSDLKCVDSLVLLLKDVIKLNLVFVKEMVLVFVYVGLFVNIVYGCNSVIVINIVLKLVDYVIIEVGFGVDLGMEKFLYIK